MRVAPFVLTFLGWFVVGFLILMEIFLFAVMIFALGVIVGAL